MSGGYTFNFTTVAETPAAKTLSTIGINCSSASANPNVIIQPPLIVTANYTNGTTAAVTSATTFSSTNSNIAYVTGRSLYSGNTEGTATITATYTESGVTKTTSFNVVVQAAAKTLLTIGINYSSASANPNVTIQPPLIVTANYTNGTTAVVTSATTFSSTNRNIAYVTGNSLHSGNTEGTATITAKYTESGVTRTTSFNVVVQVAPAPVTVGNIMINNGDATTTNPVVTVTISSTGASQMKVSTDASFAGKDWEAYTTSKGITLTSDIGTKSVFVKFKNAQGIESDVYSDTIAVVNMQVAEYLDVPKSHWAYNYIMDMTRRGILAGTGNNRFSPEDAVTREQFAKILTLSLNLPHTNRPAASPFIDVDISSGLYEYIVAAKEYLTGYKNGDVYSFRPTNNAVREDMIVAIVLAKNLGNEAPIWSVLDSYADVNQISANFVKYMSIAVKYGIVEGNAGYLMPQGTLTRAEACALIYKSSLVVSTTEEKVVGHN